MSEFTDNMRWLLRTFFFLAIPIILTQLLPVFLGEEEWDELVHRWSVYLNGFLFLVIAVMASALVCAWDPSSPAAPLEHGNGPLQGEPDIPSLVSDPLMEGQTQGEFETPEGEPETPPTGGIPVSERLAETMSKLRFWKQRHDHVSAQLNAQANVTREIEASKGQEIEDLTKRLQRAISLTEAGRHDFVRLKVKYDQDTDALIKQRENFRSESQIQAQLYSNSCWDKADVERYARLVCEQEYEAKLAEVREHWSEKLQEVADRTRNERAQQFQLLTNDRDEFERELMAAKADLVHVKGEAETERRNHDEWKRLASAEYWQLRSGCEKHERAMQVVCDWTASAAIYKCEGVDQDGDYEMCSPGSPSRAETPTVNTACLRPPATPVNAPIEAMSVQQMEEMNVNLRRELVKHESLTTELVKENNHLRGEITRVEGEGAMTIKSASDMLEAVRREKDTLKSAMESLQSQNGKLATDHARLEEELGQLHITSQKSNEADLAARAERNAQYESQITSLREDVRSLREDKAKLLSNASCLRDKVSEITASKRNLEIEYDYFKRQRSEETARDAARDDRSIRQDSGNHGNEISELQSEVSRLQSEKSELATSMQALETAHGQVQAAKDVATAEVARLMQEGSGAPSSETSALQAEIDRLRSLIGTLQAENSEAVASHTNETSEIQSEILRLRAEKSELAASKEALQVEHSKVQAEKDAANAEIARLMHEGNELLVKFSNLEEESLHNNIPGLKAEKAKAVSEAERLTAQVSELQDKISELEVLHSEEAQGVLVCQDEALEEVTRLTRLGNDLENRYNQLKSEYQDACDERDDASTGCQLLREMNSDLQAKCDRLESERQTAVADAPSSDDTAAAISLLQTSSKMLSEENHALRTENNGLKAEGMASIGALRDDNNKLQEEISNLKAQILNSNSMAAGLQAQAEALKDQETMIGMSDPELQSQLRESREQNEEARRLHGAFLYLTNKLRHCTRELNEQLNDVNECAEMKDFQRLLLLLECAPWQHLVINCKAIWNTNRSQLKLPDWTAAQSTWSSPAARTS